MDRDKPLNPARVGAKECIGLGAFLADLLFVVLVSVQPHSCCWIQRGSWPALQHPSPPASVQRLRYGNTPAGRSPATEDPGLDIVHIPEMDTAANCHLEGDQARRVPWRFRQ